MHIMTVAAIVAIALASVVISPHALAQGTPSAGATPGVTPLATPGAVAPVTVTGTIVFPAAVAVGSPATIHVRIEDVSRADAPATVLASVTLEAVTVPPPAGASVTVAIPVTTYDPGARYTVRVHVDRDGDDRVSRGDLVSTAHHPVLTAGAGTVVTIPVSVV
jgi:uncharacterized lipoprotein YbaY